ncbi:lysophospholipid acyltransferase family protein [soil metagenome]
MKYLFVPFRILYKIYFLLYFAISLILIYPFLYYLLYKPARYPKAFVLIRYFSKCLFFFTGILLKVKGKENIPESGAYVICSNHTSFLDAFCIYAIFQEYFVFVGKKEIEKWPLFHIVYTSGMNILVDRNNEKDAAKGLKRMFTEIDKGRSIVLFPEGTISKNAPKMGPFKPGAFAVAIQKQVPVVPITFVTNWKRLERSGIFKGRGGPGISEIVIHKPVLTKGLKKTDLNQLQNQVQDIIKSGFD